MTQEPKLLTEARWHQMLEAPASEIEKNLAELRERGLIAPEPEPVDPLHLLAVQIKDYLNPEGDEQDIAWIKQRAGEMFDIWAADLRGMELRPELTREMVATELRAIRDRWQSEYDDYASYGGGRLPAEGQLASKILAANEIIAALTKGTQP